MLYRIARDATLVLVVGIAMVISAVGISPAQPQGGDAQIAGTYEGKVARRIVKGPERETRLFRVTMNPDLNTGKVLVFELEGKLRNELAFVVKRVSGTTYEGETFPINATPGYRPDKIKLMFARDGAWLNWFHSDGTTEGSGTLRR